MIEYGTFDFPVPRSVPPEAGMRVPNVSLPTPGLAAAIRNHPVVVAPMGLAVPFSVAMVPVSDDGAFVVVDGCAGGVVKVINSPKLVPTLFFAMAQ